MELVDLIYYKQWTKIVVFTNDPFLLCCFLCNMVGNVSLDLASWRLVGVIKCNVPVIMAWCFIWGEEQHFYSLRNTILQCQIRVPETDFSLYCCMNKFMKEWLTIQVRCLILEREKNSMKMPQLQTVSRIRPPCDFWQKLQSVHEK